MPIELRSPLSGDSMLSSLWVGTACCHVYCFATATPRHNVIVSECQSVTVSQWYTVTVSQWHSVTMIHCQECHSDTVSQCQSDSATVSLCPVTLWPVSLRYHSDTVTPSECHGVTLDCHTVRVSWCHIKLSRSRWEEAVKHNSRWHTGTLIQLTD